jgi:serine/threonine-protein kinase RIO1
MKKKKTDNSSQLHFTIKEIFDGIGAKEIHQLLDRKTINISDGYQIKFNVVTGSKMDVTGAVTLDLQLIVSKKFKTSSVISLL